MVKVEENDLMLDFYLAEPQLQQTILDEYRILKPGSKKIKNLLDFLKDKPVGKRHAEELT